MKSVLDYLRPERWLKMWHKFDIEGIVHKEFVPPGQTVNRKFYCHFLRWRRKNIWCNVQTCGATTPGPWIMTTLRLTSRLIVQQFLASTNMTVIPHHPYSTDLTLWFSPIPGDETKTQGVTFWQHWRDPGRIAEHDVDTDMKWLPEMLPVTEILLESLYQCQRGQLWRGWGWKEISVRS